MIYIKGHHHLSMITKDIQANNYFYETVLGLRRVKKTVNQDDPSMYHLFFGDRKGTPGTELTFFDMPMAGSTHRGSNAFTKIGLVVSSEGSLHYWKNRLEQYNIPHGKITTYAHRPALQFADPDGLKIIFVVEEKDTLDSWEAWEKSPVPAEHQIRGVGPVEITVRRLSKIIRTLTEVFHYEEINRKEDEVILQSSHGNTFSELVIKYLDEPTERPGRGSIHHLAIRAKDEAELKHWDKLVRQRGFVSTGIIDRFYFKSLYFRESNGILFEIATDGPGFIVDSDIDTLGEKLDLPPSLENQREAIEAQLKPIEGE